MFSFNDSELRKAIASTISSWRKEFGVCNLADNLSKSPSAIDKRMAGKNDFSFQEICKVLWLCSGRNPDRYSDLLLILGKICLELILKSEERQFESLLKATKESIEKLG